MKETMKELIFGFSFVKNHYMLWKKKEKLTIGAMWCVKENKLSLKRIISNKIGAPFHMYYVMEGLT
jgi:hypothetical protein